MDIHALHPPNLSGGFIFVFDNDNIQEGDVTFGPTGRLDFPYQLKWVAAAFCCTAVCSGVGRRTAGIHI